MGDKGYMVGAPSYPILDSVGVTFLPKTILKVLTFPHHLIHRWSWGAP